MVISITESFMKRVFTILTSGLIIALSTQSANAQQIPKSSDNELNFISRVTQILTLKNNPALTQVSAREQLDAGYHYCTLRQDGMTEKKIQELFVDEIIKYDEKTRPILSEYFSTIQVVATRTLCQDVKD